MDKFQEAYREAVEELPEFHMDADRVQDELHHYKMLKQGRKYLITRGCTAAAVFLLCGAGTVAAKSIRDSIIRVNDNGFVITSENAMPDTGHGKGIPDTASILKAGGVFSTEDGIPDDDIPEEAEVVEYYPEVDEYDSLDTFLAQSDMAAEVPFLDRRLLGVEFTDESVHVIDGGKRVFISLYNEDEGIYFSMTQSDNRGYESYSTATAYMGESRNERSYTNGQGMNYVVIDSVDENETVISVHAAISVNGRDLTLSFEGFDESTVEKVLYGLDLSVYFQE